MKTLLTLIGAGVLLVIVTILGLVATGVGTYNSIINKSQTVDSSWANVQSVYQRRSDLIPNLVNTVKGAATFEKDTFIGVADARASVGRVTISKDKAPESAEQLQAFDKAQGNISQALSRLMMISENYPQLKATDAFRDLTAQLEGTENRISVERRNFNLGTQDYNSTIQRFPGTLLANFFGFKAKPYFEASEKAQTAPEVKF